MRGVHGACGTWGYVGAGLLWLCVGACKDDGKPAEQVDFGDFSQFADVGWIDTHVHLPSHRRIDAYIAFQDRFGIDRMVLQSAPNAASLLEGARPNFNAEAFLAKARYPERFYVFAGIDLTPLLSGGESALQADLEAQIDQIADAGADGIKLLFRFSLVEPLAERGINYLPDNPAMAPLFETAKARGLPVLVHIDERYFASAQAAVDLYPEVTWIVTHMAWSRTDVDRLETILDAGPSFYIDVGHFLHLGELLPAGQAAVEFLTDHGTRVFAGSDFGSGCGLRDTEDDDCPTEPVALDQAWRLRAMLETEQPIEFTSAYTGEPMVVTGLDLSPSVLRAMYREGPLALLDDPAPVRCAAALAHIDRLIERTSKSDEVSRLQEIRSELQGDCR